MQQKVTFSLASSRLFGGSEDGSSCRRPILPPGRRIFAMGDIHGRCDLLATLLSQITQLRETHSADDLLVFLGDYIDRGPDSRKVVDLLDSLPKASCKFLRGNHDQCFLDFLKTPITFRSWRQYGAVATLLSYGVEPPRFGDTASLTRARDELAEKCPPNHVSFFNSLEMFYQEGDYVFVHAGLRPGVPLPSQRLEDILSIRGDFLGSSEPRDYIVVHGHTPSERPVVRPNRLGIDTGAYATDRLTAAVLEGDRVGFLSTGSPFAID